MKHRLLVPLNRQQLELMDRTIAQGVAPDRAALLRLALREYGPPHRAPAAHKQPTAEPAKESA
ncbi:hypothetical protein WKW79_04130 [Variovorax robiniae]|uniref:Ribbon-helix-helix protein CopG domain-containing protein n=1 Tax=Variovorax robiniae TaxID=1836199 RepID=A0ABU8X1X1_9BURK